MFQQKAIHNILVTKGSLFRVKICDYNVCPQSLNKTLYLGHVFFSLLLGSVVAFWRTFQIWWTNKTGKTLT